MGLIPKTDSVEETEIKVTAAKEVHAARVEVETRLRTRLQAAGAQVEALTAAAGDASADIYLREASGETEEGVAMCRETAAKKIAELDAAKAEQIALQNALRIAEGQATDARLAVVRIQNRNHMVRVSKLLERMFNEVGRLELAIETSAESWKKINGHFETLVSCWPGDQNTLAMIAPRGALYDLISQHMHKASCVLDKNPQNLGFTEPRSRLPGSKCSDVTLASQPDKLPTLSDEFDRARQHLVAILDGKVSERDGSPIAKSEAPVVIQRGAELRGGKLLSDAEPVVQPLPALAKAVAQATQHGAHLKDGKVVEATVPRLNVEAPPQTHAIGTKDPVI